MKQFKYFFFFIFVALIFYNCTSGTSVSNYNYSYLYDDEPSIPRPVFQVFHKSKTISELHFKLNSKNILYSKTPQDTTFSARLLIKYKIYDWNNRKNILDSATIPIVDYGKNNEQRNLTGSFNVNVEFGNKYFVEIRTRDSNRDLNVLNYYTIDKQPNSNRQFYLMKDTLDNVIFEDYLKNSSPIIIEKSNLIQNNKLQVGLSREILPIAAPPFSEVEPYDYQIRYDSSYLLSFFNDTATFTPTSSSIHHLYPEMEANNGFFIFHYRDDYPFITDPSQMVEPLRYISTQTEYNNLTTTDYLKNELDDFWLRMAGNEDRARKVMGEYYGRVEKNNLYFTSYKEGWKTDRGIIYLIYGPPSTIYKTPTFESWIYGEEANILSLTFKFRKRDNPMSDNDFILMRDISMKPSWYREVDSWRQGRIN